MLAEDLRQINDLLAARDLKRAEVQIARLLRGEPLAPAEEATVLALRARARLLAARPEEALDDIGAARKQSSDADLHTALTALTADSYFARFELAATGFADRADVSRADAVYRGLIEESPDYPDLAWLHYQRGRIALTDGRAEAAIAAFTQALLAPSPLPALAAFCFERLGFVYFYEMRDAWRALNFLNRALHTYPAGEDRVWVARLHTLRARVLRERGDEAGALATIEEAISIASSADESKIALADALLTAAELHAQTSGREREVISRVGQFLATAKKPPGIDVTWSRAYEMLGNACFNTGQYAQASDAYQSALQYNPYHPWEQGLRLQIARALYQQQAYERAIAVIEALLTAAEKEGQLVSDYRAFDLLGSAHFALQQYGAARAAYERALALSPAAEDRDKIERYRGFAAELAG
jgi:tetratricopeptide (TPR) repeat protein